MKHNNRKINIKIKQITAAHKKRKSGIEYVRGKDRNCCMNN